LKGKNVNKKKIWKGASQ